jgi:NTE family protein
VGVFLSSNNVNDIQLGLGARTTFFGMAGPGSEVRVNASVGQVAGVSGELYKPLVVGKRYFVAPRAYYARTVSGFFPVASNWRSTRRRRMGLASISDTYSTRRPSCV